MINSRTRWYVDAVALLATLVIAAACGDDPTVPPQIASIELSSPVDTILVKGGGASLTAEARTAAGAPVEALFTWASSDPTVASVSDDGAVQAIAAGTATITAAAEEILGQLSLRVVDADVLGITGLLGDPLRPHLVTPLQSVTRTQVQSSFTSATQALAAGNVVAFLAALEEVATEADAATHADDRALLATLKLITEHAIRLLNL